MPSPTRSHGFSLIELLLVLAILGILSGIAIPSFMGQRKRARVIGDAQTNARILAMALESHKADIGIYNASSINQSWTASGATPTASASLAPLFIPKGNSQMNYSVQASRFTYTITVKDPKRSGTPIVLTADQTGAITVNTTY
jgi:prepilin-type N-terminal cleavage/methylation domain-containing protein